MASAKYIKVVLLGGWTLLIFVWMISGSLSGITGAEHTALPGLTANYNPDDYVGSETCQACHEDAFKSFSGTKHGKLAGLASWKNKVQGCESCHGPGKAHVEAGGDKTKIISFKNFYCIIFKKAGKNLPLNFFKFF